MTDKPLILQPYETGEKYPRCALTEQQKKQLQICIANLLINAPFFADITLSQMVWVPTMMVPIAATDGKHLFYNPLTFFAYKTDEQAFIVAHEVMHYIYGDVPLMWVWRRTKKVMTKSGSLDYDDNLMGQAADYSINALLIEAQVGRFNTDWLYDASLSEKGIESSVTVYEKMIKKGKGKKPGKTDGDQPGGGGQPGVTCASDDPPEVGPNKTPRQFDKHLNPGEGESKDPDQAVNERNEAEVRVAVARAAASAEARGKLPAALKRFIGDILEPKVAWQEQIKTLAMRRAGADGLDWTQLDEQFLARPEPYSAICWPAETSFGAGTVVIGMDTSGSMDDQPTRDRLFAEAGGIVAAINPRVLIVVWCDARVGRHDTLDEPEDLQHYRLEVNEEGVFGGGGTSFVPVFDHIEREGIEPDCLIYFTDLYGDFPARAPKYPVIWGATTNAKAPFGDIVRVEL